MRRLTPSPSMAVALGALVVALGGTAAATGFISGRDIRDGTITLRDLSPSVRGQVLATGASGPRGATGAPGAPGVPGLQGAPGGFDTSKLVTVLSPSVLVPAGGLEFNITATCPPGARPTGGGFFSSIAKASRSAPTFDGWNVFVYNDTTVDVSAEAYVVCARQ